MEISVYLYVLGLRISVQTQDNINWLLYVWGAWELQKNVEKGRRDMRDMKRILLNELIWN